MNKTIASTIEEVADILSQSDKEINIQGGYYLPSEKSLGEFMDLLRKILFPCSCGNQARNNHMLKYHISVDIEKAVGILSNEIDKAQLFIGLAPGDAEHISLSFIKKIPAIRHSLSTDIDAIFDADPAAFSRGEILFCYPSIVAMTHYRVAHELVRLGVPLLPRIITEMAHSKTGIDIHPSAQIADYFAIDHGTGVVIGETCIIGKGVKLYQGVTLGARSFTLDENGNPINTPRHPIIEDGVTIYSNASILGRIVIGAGSVIGGNTWVTSDVAPNSRISQQTSKSDK